MSAPQSKGWKASKHRDKNQEVPAPDVTVPQQTQLKDDFTRSKTQMFRNCPFCCWAGSLVILYCLGVIFFWRIEQSLMKVPFNLLLKGSDCLPPPPLTLLPVRECPPTPTKLNKGTELGISLYLGRSPVLSSQPFAKASISYLPGETITVHANIPYSEISKSNIIGVEVMSRGFEIKYVLGDRGEEAEAGKVHNDRFEAIGGWASLYRRRDVKGDTYRQFWQKTKSRDMSYYGIMDDSLVPTDDNSGSVSPNSTFLDKLPPESWVIRHLDLVLLYPNDEPKPVSSTQSKSTAGKATQATFFSLPLADRVTSYISLINKAQASAGSQTASNDPSPLAPSPFYKPLLLELSSPKPSSHYAPLPTTLSDSLAFSASFSIWPESRFHAHTHSLVMLEQQFVSTFPRFSLSSWVESVHEWQSWINIWPEVLFLLLWAASVCIRIRQGKR